MLTAGLAVIDGEPVLAQVRARTALAVQAVCVAVAASNAAAVCATCCAPLLSPAYCLLKAYATQVGHPSRGPSQGGFPDAPDNASTSCSSALAAGKLQLIYSIPVSEGVIAVKLVVDPNIIAMMAGILSASTCMLVLSIIRCLDWLFHRAEPSVGVYVQAVFGYGLPILVLYFTEDSFRYVFAEITKHSY